MDDDLDESPIGQCGRVECVSNHAVTCLVLAVQDLVGTLVRVHPNEIEGWLTVVDRLREALVALRGGQPRG